MDTLWANSSGSVWSILDKFFMKIIYPAIGASLRMLFFCVLFSCIFGFFLAVLLVMYNPLGLKPRPVRYRILDFCVNLVRSFPLVVLIVAILPLTQIVVGKSIGEWAAIFPLTVAATPFVARMIESAFISVDKQLIEAARSFGASNLQILFRVMFKEAVPELISIVTLASISQLAATTLAGTVGGGGLGAVALNYGFYSFNKVVLYTSVAILLVIVLVIQGVGSLLYKKAL